MKKNLFFYVGVLLLWSTPLFATVSITISSGLATDTICRGTPVTFTATPGTGSYGYIWNVNGTYVGTSSPTYTTFMLPPGIDEIYCVLTNAAGDTIYDLSDTLTIVVHDRPHTSPIIGPAPANVCIGSIITLSDSTAGGAWASADPALATVSMAGVVGGVGLPAGGPPGVYIYYITTNDCGSDSARIRVGTAVPAGPIMIGADTLCIGSSVTLNDTARGGTWTSSDTTIGSVGLVAGGGGPPTVQLTGHNAGAITITYTGTNACGAYTETVTATVRNCDTTAAVNDVSNTGSFNIYPNPSTGTFHVMLKSQDAKTATCIIVNMMGEKVKQLTIDTNKETNIAVNVAGVYLMTISTATERYCSQILVLH